MRWHPLISTLFPYTTFFRSANVLWGKALTVGNTHLAPLMNLAALAEDWGKDPDEVLWTIVQRFPQEQWALRKLESRYIANRSQEHTSELQSQFQLVCRRLR